jgi:hypothetical protein
LDRGLLTHPSTVISWRCLTAAPGSDASAIHGRLSARVALLQSPILPAALSLYSGKRLFRNLPVDKPHTCNLRHVTPKTLQKAQYVGCSESAQPQQVAYFGWSQFPVPGSAPRRAGLRPSTPDASLPCTSKPASTRPRTCLGCRKVNWHPGTRSRIQTKTRDSRRPGPRLRNSAAAASTLPELADRTHLRFRFTTFCMRPHSIVPSTDT